jgi:hypothetical protein
MRRLLKFRAGVGSQVLVYENGNIEHTIDLDYGPAAYQRGYAIGNCCLAFFPIAEDCIADIAIWEGRPGISATFEGVTQGRLFLSKGELCIHEPEAPPLILSVPPGDYSVVFAQTRSDVEDFHAFTLQGVLCKIGLTSL